jgi:glycosyltransferase involved in cell wall biosynthesis
MMHLGVDASAISRDLRGMGRYARQLLAAMPSIDTNLRYTIGARDSADVAVLRAQLSEAEHILERATVVPLTELANVACDVMWYPCNFITTLPAAGAPVPTVHDLFPMLQLDGRWWKVIKRARAKSRYARTIATAAHVITGATAARDEITATFGVSAERISVVPHAADGFRVVDPSRCDALLERLGVTGPFLLAVGSQESRKNLGVLYAAMRDLDARGVKIPLVQCGPRGAHGYRPGDALPSWLHHAGFVSDDELAALYSRATALVFPSRYEGFGLPVLEALTAGGVVICADSSTMPEVGGDAALYFPPDDAAVLASHVTRLLAEPELRSDLQQRGLARAANYSWERSAAGTLAAFRAAMLTYASAPHRGPT